MTYPIEQYKEPPTQEVITPIPTIVTVAGEQYVLASRGQNLPLPAPHLQHQVPRAEVARINGVEHARTAEGWRPIEPTASPYAPNPGQVPSWIKHPYTKGYGLLLAAGIMGTLLACVAVALFTLVTAVMAHALQIGMTILVIFVGGLVFLGALTKARHGHAPSRGRH